VDDMSRAAKTLGDKGPKLIDDLGKLASDLKEVVGENRYTLKESMENLRTVSKSASNIAQRIESGEGTLGKLVKEDKFYNSINKISEEAGKSMMLQRLSDLGFPYRIQHSESEWKGYLLTLQPRKDKYYILALFPTPRA
jgi:phospholipid/cholesterol/gamma-HCH transport system substrate-binding protein